MENILIQEVKGEGELSDRIQKIMAFFGTEGWAAQMRCRYYVGNEILEEWKENFESYYLENGIDWKTRGRELQLSGGGPSGKPEGGRATVEYSLNSLAKSIGGKDIEILKQWIDFAYLINQDEDGGIEIFIKEHWGDAFSKILHRLKTGESEKDETLKNLELLYSSMQTVSNCITRIDTYIQEGKEIKIGGVNMTEFWRRTTETQLQLIRLRGRQEEKPKETKILKLDWRPNNA